MAGLLRVMKNPRVALCAYLSIGCWSCLHEGPSSDTEGLKYSPNTSTATSTSRSPLNPSFRVHTYTIQTTLRKVVTVKPVVESPPSFDYATERVCKLISDKGLQEPNYYRFLHYTLILTGNKEVARRFRLAYSEYAYDCVRIPLRLWMDVFSNANADCQLKAQMVLYDEYFNDMEKIKTLRFWSKLKSREQWKCVVDRSGNCGIPLHFCPQIEFQWDLGEKVGKVRVKGGGK
jgi:hypothetical protein